MSLKKPKLIRLTTVALSQNLLLRGQLRFLNQKFEVIAVASGKEELEQVGVREGVRTVDIKMHRDISLIADLNSLIALYTLFRNEKPEIVHANTPKCSLLSMFAATLAGTKNRIYTVTGLRFETEKGIFRRLLKFMEIITCAFATKVIPEGKGVRDTLIREHITNKPLEIIYNGNINGVDLNWYASSHEVRVLAERYIDNNVFTFCFIGRVVRDKGLEELIGAFSRLSKIYINTRLLLIGPFEKELSPLKENIINEIDTNSKIRYMGYQDDIRPFLQASDVLVLPSYREGFPNVVLQAGAMGLPCIVTNINGCNEIIQDKVNGLIVPVRNEDRLFEAMTRLLNNTEETYQMSTNARRIIAERYNQQNVWSCLEKMYLSL
ncbi:MAG: glycosyltransferase family 4 protein [Bacteroidales bacterium]